MAVHSHKHSDPLPPILFVLTLIITLSLTGLVWKTLENNIENRARLNFEKAVQSTTALLQQRMYAYEAILLGGVGLFKASDSVTRGEWRSYTESLELRHILPGVQGVGYAEVIPADQLQAHINRVRAEGFPGYSVKPAGTRNPYTAIIYLEPFDFRNKRAFGYDMFAEPVRHAAMALARDSGEPVLSGKIKLVQETDQDIQAGFLMYAPLYRKGAPIRTVEERRMALRGYVYSPFRINDLVDGLLDQHDELKEIDTEIYDGAGPLDSSTMMYDSDARTGKNHAVLFRKTVPITVDQHQWTLVFHTTPAFQAGIDHSPSRIAVASGSLLSVLLALIIWQLSTHRQRAHRLALEMSEAARERESRLNAVLGAAADGIVTTNQYGTIMSANQAAEAMFAYTHDEILGLHASALLSSPDEFISSDSSDLSYGDRHEVIGVRKNGQTFPMELAVRKIDSHDGRVYVGIIRDITERHEAEEALRLSEERFDLAVQGAYDGLWDWDILRHHCYRSPRWKEMLGYADNEIGIGEDEWISRLHPHEREQILAQTQDAIESGANHIHLEYRMRHKNGHYIWFLSRAMIQRDADNRAIRMVGIHTDISERKQVDRLKNEFISTVSHELRTPLTSIIGTLGLVTAGAVGPLPKEAHSLLDIAKDNSQRLLTLINDILDMDRIQSGRLSLVLAPYRLNALLQQALASNRDYASQYSVTYVLTDQINDSVVIDVDPTRFAQIMSNLMSNAAKFSHEGGQVELGITLCDTDVEICVTDHGIGIPSEFADKLFEKFTQADSSDTRHRGGTGLGLSITKALVELMHGNIRYTSRIQAGTTFCISFPLASHID